MGPLKSLQRTLLFGLSGGLLLAIGLVLLDVAGLRALEEETGRVFARHWTWVPGVIAGAGAFVLVGITIGVMLRSMKRATSRRTSPAKELAGNRADKEIPAA